MRIPLVVTKWPCPRSIESRTATARAYAARAWGVSFVCASPLEGAMRRHARATTIEIRIMVFTSLWIHRGADELAHDTSTDLNRFASPLLGSHGPRAVPGARSPRWQSRPAQR